MGPTLRRMTPADIETAAAIAFAANARPYPGPDIRRYIELEPEGWFVALDDGEPAGIGGLTVFGDHGVVGLMATRPERQRRGIGGAVFARLLEVAERRGLRTLSLDATEEGAPLYRRHGFTEIDRTVVWERASTPPPGPGPVAAREMTPGDLSAAAALDQRAFGADRGRLLALLLAAFPGRAAVAPASGGPLRAYAIAQQGRVGPAVAEEPAHAEAVLDAVLHLSFEEPLRILVPESNAWAVPLLRSRGFSPRRSTRYMVRGEPVPPERRARVLGLASFGLG